MKCSHGSGKTSKSYWHNFPEVETIFPRSSESYFVTNAQREELNMRSSVGNHQNAGSTDVVHMRLVARTNMAEAGCWGRRGHWTTA